MNQRRLACPRDRTALVVHATGCGTANHCGACAGLWLPHAVVAAHVGEGPSSASIERVGTATRWRCPEDATPLLAVVHHGVEVDLCPRCRGLWLDHGELERIVAGRGAGTGQLVQEVADGAVEVVARGVDPGDVGDAASELLSAVFEFLGGLFSGW